MPPKQPYPLRYRLFALAAVFTMFFFTTSSPLNSLVPYSRSRVAPGEKTIAEAGFPLQVQDDLAPTPTANILKRAATVTGHAALAAASGMKPAAVASLPFPTKALNKTESFGESVSCAFYVTSAS